ncbi:MAG: AmmeMemoRadiSam system protein A [Gammaproteobacteria bacterium]|nr:AmmeMemoRadiSam system protein A [Gammaproteobacteria bacterium]
MNDQALLDIARRSIEHGLYYQQRWLPEIREYPPAWHEQRASFVTLKRLGDLRGCIGTTEAIDPLVVSVARNAYSAAFNDPRFPALSVEEYDSIELSLSLLTPAEAVEFTCEAELLDRLVPGHDGLIIEHGNRRATFLPSVWESLSTPDEFLTALKHKAGLTVQQAPERAWRYSSETISE